MMREADKKPIWIGIQGGDCSGKTTLSREIASQLEPNSTLIIELDTFYHPFDRTTVENDPTLHNFDHPSALDWELAREVINALNSGNSVRLPAYDYVSGLRHPGELVSPHKYIIVNSLWAFFDKHLSKLYKVRVYIDIPPDVRLVRRLSRELSAERRGWSLADALRYYMHCVRPSDMEFVVPGKAEAHIVVSGEENPEIGASLVVRGLNSYRDAT